MLELTFLAAPSSLYYTPQTPMLNEHGGLLVDVNSTSSLLLLAMRFIAKFMIVVLSGLPQNEGVEPQISKTTILSNDLLTRASVGKIIRVFLDSESGVNPCFASWSL